MNNDDTLFLTGARRADSMINDATDYDRVLWGLSEVLSERGVVADPHTLSDLFHDPLATGYAGADVSTLAKAMATRLLVEVPLVPPCPRHSWISYDVDQNDERALNGHIAAVGRLVDTDSEWTKRVNDAWRPVENWRLRGVVVKALGLDTSVHDTALATYKAKLIEREEQVKETAREEIEAATRRIAELPIERAESLQPLSSLRLRTSVFEGNQALADTGFVTDGRLLIDGASAKDQKLFARLSAMTHEESRSYGEKECRRVLDKTARRADKVVTIAGFLIWQRYHSAILLAVLVADDSDRVFTVNAEYLKLARRVVDFDEIRATEDGNYFVFYRGSKVAASLAGFRAELKVDADAARKRAEEIRET